MMRELATDISTWVGLRYYLKRNYFLPYRRALVQDLEMNSGICL
jgi:hypothetical protein